MKIERHSPAKINLLLNILGKRPDGFHEIETVLHPVDLYDRLVFETPADEVQLTCNQPSLPVDPANLVVRAAQAFLQATGIRAGVRIHLEKRIPLAAGLGGGSSNAAITLQAMNDLFGGPLKATELPVLAARLGSDVPFFLQAMPALGSGRGERIAPLTWFPALHPAWLLLIHPGFGVPTAWAYQNLARYPEALNGEPERAQQLIAKLQEPNLAAAKGAFYNALERPVLAKYPLLALFQEFLRENGAVVSLMSGSGSTTFALFPEPSLAEQARQEFLQKFSARCWTSLTRLPGKAGPTSACEHPGACMA